MGLLTSGESDGGQEAAELMHGVVVREEGGLQPQNLPREGGAQRGVRGDGDGAPGEVLCIPVLVLLLPETRRCRIACTRRG